jgi:predicted MFS family arabinose efflux permease
LVFGAGAILGNAFGGFLTDRIGPFRALVLLCSVQFVAMPALTLLHVPLLLTGALILGWSVFGWSVNVPQQARLAALDPARAPVLIALHAAAIYVGTSVGSLVGGRVLIHFGHSVLGLVGAGLMGTAWLSLMWAKRFDASR